MTTTYQAIIDKAERILIDEGSDQTTRRWTETELLGWATESEGEIAKLKPDSYPVVETVALASGSQQSLPTSAIQLLDVLCNMGTNGTTRGDVVEVVEKKIMNAINPGWLSDTANTTVTHVIYDTKRSPKLYWVYPKSPGTNYLEIMTTKLPDNSSKVIGDNILLGDEYTTAMMHYILFNSFLKDLDIPSSSERANVHQRIFNGLLGIRETAEETYNPKKTRDKN
ncbi:MAG: phage adaptor protein [Planctomycetota bacterium]|jgi:hypothetical protein